MTDVQGREDSKLAVYEWVDDHTVMVSVSVVMYFECGEVRIFGYDKQPVFVGDKCALEDAIDRAIESVTRTAYRQLSGRHN